MELYDELKPGPALSPEEYDRSMGMLHDVLVNFQAQVHQVTDAETLQEVVTACIQMRQPYIAIDIETGVTREFADWTVGPKNKRSCPAALHPSTSFIRLIQLCPNGKDVYVIDCAKIDPTILNPELQRLFDAPVRFVAHNAVFEQAHLKHHGYHLNGTFSCTRLTARAQGITEGLSLADRVLTEFGLELVKGAATGGSHWAAPELSSLQYLYAALDALLVFHLFDRDRIRLRSINAGHEYLMYHNAQPATVAARLAGVPIDRARLDAYIAEREQAVTAAKAAVEAVMPGVNTRSNVQLTAWVKAALPDAVATWPKTPKGALKFSEDALASLAHLPGVRELVHLNQMTNLHTAAVGWRDYINPVTGRIHASLMIAQAATGRFACGEPNLQNISGSASARAVFAAAVGYLLIGCDYSQIELRLIAVLAMVALFLETYQRGGDVYVDTARAIFGISDAQWAALSDAERKAYRTVGKVLCLALNYRAGPSTLQRQMLAMAGKAISIEEATDLHARYLKTTGLDTWHAQITAAARASMTMTSAAGRVRRFALEGFKGHELYTHPANTRIQASGADLVLDAWANIHTRLQQECPAAELILTVHDEFLAHAPEADAPLVAKILQEEMQASVVRILGPLAEPIMNGIANPIIGKNWAEVH